MRTGIPFTAGFLACLTSAHADIFAQPKSGVADIRFLDILPPGYKVDHFRVH